MKTKEEILNQMYMSANDLKMIMPELGIKTCRKYIDETRIEMASKGYCVPEGKTKLALTKELKKRFGWK